MDCIFCEIAQKKARSKIIWENEKFMAFENINPQAPVHLLVISKNHIDKKDAISGGIPGIWDELMNAVNQVIKKLALDESGYRLVNNGAGYHAIEHEHIHILGGKGWRPADDL